MPVLFYNDSWVVVSLFDAAGNVVQIGSLVSGETGMEVEPINQAHTKGEYQSGERNTVMAASTEWGGQDQLSTWKNARTPLAMVALSTDPIGRNLRWTDQYRRLKENRWSPKGLRSEGDSFLKAVLEDFDDEPIRKRNLLHDEAGNPVSIILPIAGFTLVAAADYSAINTDPTLKIEALDYGSDGSDGSVIGSDSLLVSTDGRKSVSLNLPAGTWRVRVDTLGAGDATVENISLRADGETEYLAG